ncbi:J domain-containing protein, partial [Agrobacterium tumefaciens]|uniref:J domain-containing protein n=1 Tax=Agrobacterium tumefaciens TaxID=358 RepID=UPI000A69A484
IKQLEVLRTLLSTGSTIATAKAMGLRQSGISRPLAQREAELSLTRVARDKGRRPPTPPLLRLPAGLRAAQEAGGTRLQQDRKLKTLEAKAFDTLGLSSSAKQEDIKRRYKELVKKHHPDANGGDRGSEERFRAVVQAYQLLKQSGFC